MQALCTLRAHCLKVVHCGSTAGPLILLWIHCYVDSCMTACGSTANPLQASLILRIHCVTGVLFVDLLLSASLLDLDRGSTEVVQDSFINY